MGTTMTVLRTIDKLLRSLNKLLPILKTGIRVRVDTG